jgi:hypothetical protein
LVALLGVLADELHLLGELVVLLLHTLVAWAASVLMNMLRKTKGNGSKWKYR